MTLKVITQRIHEANIALEALHDALSEYESTAEATGDTQGERFSTSHKLMVGTMIEWVASIEENTKLHQKQEGE